MVIWFIRINQQISNLVNTWLIKMQSINDLSVRACLSYEQLFLQGVEYINYLNYTVSLFLNLALSLNTAITKSNLIELCKLIELVKAIQKTYYERREFLAISKQYILQSINRKLLSFIQTAKVSIHPNAFQILSMNKFLNFIHFIT